ncbi:hypothetical protein WBG99_13735 [Streptomyces sp. TG1A-60]
MAALLAARERAGGGTEFGEYGAEVVAVPDGVAAGAGAGSDS